MFLRAPIEENAVHLCIDMQHLLSAHGPWPTPWMEPALERAIRLIEPRPAQTIFTRFVPPHSPEEMPGVWRRYFEKWRSVTREFIDPSLLELLPPLSSFVPPAQTIDKGRYSAFISSLQSVLREVAPVIFFDFELDDVALAAFMTPPVFA